jgi:hypothetical protein
MPLLIYFSSPGQKSHIYHLACFHDLLKTVKAISSCPEKRSRIRDSLNMWTSGQSFKSPRHRKLPFPRGSVSFAFLTSSCATQHVLPSPRRSWLSMGRKECPRIIEVELHALSFPVSVPSPYGIGQEALAQQKQLAVPLNPYSGVPLTHQRVWR